MTTFGWLHLADLHQTVRRPGFRAADAWNALCADLESLHGRSGPWDLVLVAGDLTRRGSAEELEEAEAGLDELLAFVRALQPGVEPSLLAVPGNHEIVRADGQPWAYRALRRWHEDPAVQAEFWNDLDSPGRRLVDRALTPFEAWWKKRSAAVKGLRHGLLPGDFTVTFEKEGLRLGVAGLCSAFLQVSGDDYEGRLGLSPHQLTIAAGGDTPAWIARHDVALLVTHHPPSWLGEPDRRRYEAEINPAGRFAAHLSGHLHEAATLVEGSERVQVRSPSLFGLDTFEDRRGRPGERRAGYVVGQIELGGEGSALRLWPRMWSGDGLRPAFALAELDGEGAASLRLARFPRAAAEQAPFRLERARLREALVAIYRAASDAQRLAREAGIRLGGKLEGGAAADVWEAVLAEAERRGRLGELVKIVQLEYPGEPGIAEAWRALQGSGQPRDAASEKRDAASERLAEELLDGLAGLLPTQFDVVQLLAGAPQLLSGPNAPQARRALELVQLMERQGRSGLERLAATVARVSGSPSDGARSGGLESLTRAYEPFQKSLAAGRSHTSRRTSARTPTAASLTRLLALMFDDERDFDGFVLDHYPSAYRRFTNGMSRAYRIGLLLKAADPADVAAKLKRSHPSAFAAHQRVLDYEDPDQRG